MRIQLNINIGKQHFYFLVLLFCVLFVAGVVAFGSGGPPYRVGHSDDEISNISAEKVKAGTFGASAGNGNFTFPANLTINGNLKFASNNGRINSTSNLYLDAYNTRVGNYLTLGGDAKNSWPVAVEVPIGFCIFSDTATNCPQDPRWTKKTAFYGRTISGASGNVGGLGGYAVNSHRLLAMSRCIEYEENCDSDRPGSDMLTSMSLILPNSSWPPYINVTICCRTY